MRIRKIVKKIMALGIGVSLVGVTITGAVAADLTAYPQPFVKDGKFNGILVVGDRAAAEDVIGAVDIAASLQFAATKPVSTEKETILEGEAWKVGTYTKVFEISENLKSGTNREAIGTIVSSFIDDAELPVLLAKGKTRNSKGSAAYDQRLYFSDDTGYIQLVEDDNDVTADFLYFQNGKQIARYELEFTSALESDIDDINGRALATGNFLSDFEDVDITILGKKYTIVQATRNGAKQNQIVLGLMTGPIKDSLLESATKTYVINGVDYEVTLEFVSEDNVRFLVNGESTKLLKDGETRKLSDGTIIGVTEILYQDYAGGIHTATFFLGAQKLELKDTNVNDKASSNQLKVNEKTVNGAHVKIEGSDDNSIFKIDRIGINMTADDDYYVPAGGSLSQIPEFDQKDLLFTRNWDISYQGLSKPKTQQIAIKASGSDDYVLEFVDRNGNKAKLPLIHAVSGSTIKLGTSSNDLIIQENSTTAKDDYFIVSDESDKVGQRSSFALRYRGADKITSDSPVIKFDELGSGERIERPISVGPVLSNVVGPDGQDLFEISQIKIGGRTFKVYNASSTSAKDFDILVDMNGDNTIGSDVVALNTQYGANISITQDSDQQATVLIGTPNTNHYDDLVPTSFIFNLKASGGEVRLTLDSSQNHNFLSPDEDDKKEFAYSSYGAYARRSTPSNDPQELFIDYPQSQRVPLAYIKQTGAEFVEREKPTGAVKIQRIDVGATKLASEVKNIRDINAILVGGPCANSATASLLGNPEDCTLGFEPGVGRIEFYDANSKVAMLVAGYTKEDTRNAAQVVANYAHFKDDLKGNAAEVKQIDNVLVVSKSTLKAGKGG